MLDYYKNLFDKVRSLVSSFSENNSVVRVSEIKQSKKAAFSLAEAMITLLMVSIILAALAPVMSKKMRLTQTGFSSAAQLKKKQWFKVSPGTYDFQSTLGVTEYMVTMVAGGGGGGAAAKAAVSVPVTSTTQQVLTIPDGVNSVDITLIGAGGGGGGGEGGGGGSSSDEFKVPGGADNGQDLCVKKKNVGDQVDGALTNKSGKYVASSTTVVPVNSNCSTGNCCWYGQTAGSCDSVNTSYSGCTRTTCTWTAANATCAQMGSGWRLPTYSEMQKWRVTPSSSGSAFIASYKGSSGIDLCDAYSGYGSAQCSYSSSNSACSGSYYGDCYPCQVWSATPYGSNYYNLYFNGGYWSDNNFPSTFAFSARCVRSGSSCGFSPFAAGGGGSGAQAIVKSIAVNPTDTLTISLGTGGAGGAVGSIGSNGGITSVIHKDKNGNIIATYAVNGGAGGGGATASSHGTGGAGGSVGSNSSNITLTAGLTGTTGTASGGGQGGNIIISGTTYQGGAGGSSSIANGQSPSNSLAYGGGGGGGFATDATNKGSGGRGADGYVRIDYNVFMPGGGGGAGAAIKSYFIKTAGEEKITAIVGSGGLTAVNGTNTSFGTYAITEGGKAGLPGSAVATNYGKDSKPGIGGLGGSTITTIPAATADQKAKWVGKPGLSGYGIAGGTGGASLFGEGACGGMSSGIFVGCNLTNPIGADALNFELAGLKNGGAGGGGGGYNGATTGVGGKGGDGYIIVEWD